MFQTLHPLIDGLQYLVNYESIGKSLSFKSLLISMNRDRFLDAIFQEESWLDLLGT